MSLETITIADAASGTRAKVLPGLGFNCYGFSVATPGGGHLETLWSAPDFTDGTSKPTRNGIPLLFPFAGRIRGTSFRFGGKEFPLDEGDEQGNAIHGFVFNRPWRVIEHQPDRVSGQFHASRDDESLLAHWPADFRITATYQVAGNTLACDYLIENPDDKPLPFGFGTHPYFRVPLGGKSADDCRVTIPVSTVWELASLLPTGKHEPSPIAAQLAAGMKVGEMKLDTVLGGITFHDHRAPTSIADPSSGRTIVQTFDDQFTTCVVFNPPHRQAVCIEPYTTVPDPFTLAEQGIDPSLRLLPPGGTFRTRIELRVD
jgi:aldose 1-epimerase